MEEAAAVRRAALEAVDDVAPARLFERIEQRIQTGSMAPGALTHLSATTVSESMGQDGTTERAAGVQLIYEGLRLTRTLAEEHPWDNDELGDGWQPVAATADRSGIGGKSRAAAAADMDILVADILVARGFYLLARTDAATAAVSVVQSFGREQTVRQETDDPSHDTSLEVDILELAVIAGTTAAGGSLPVNLREFVAGLVDSERGLAAAETVLTESVVEQLAGRLHTESATTGEARTSADH